TAIGAARGRATESARPDRLIDDPFAARFVDAAGAAAQPPSNVDGVDARPLIDAYVGMRSRFFDDTLLEAVGAGLRQVVVLGAGLDTRAFRLVWPTGTRLFEVDVRDVFAFKEPVLQDSGACARCARVIVPEDLRDDWPQAMCAVGFVANQPTAWLVEGLLMYLEEADRDQLLARVSRLSADRSRMALEPPGWTIPHHLAPSGTMGHMDQELVGKLATAGEAARVDASVDDPVAWLAGYGWRAQVYPAAERFAAYGRPIPEPLQQLRRFLATAERDTASGGR
ncbi:MAG: SAM-dependent methyltransferase, partial [Chloroflexi bacterium]|nr:SAM-dependent methyltransferase [Chloroflexota bacterium]